jgi:hypothetical protein
VPSRSASAKVGTPPASATVWQPLFDDPGPQSLSAGSQINLSFKNGLLFGRMELLIDRQAVAAALFSGPYYFAE